ncbi:unnamed protein product [Rodentolepis nana]|uniref:Tensin 1 n=1 Tax=Rodentolepis nana TaxID=102285 RepID=A0A158QHZ2_RODNA|nr:unnamed protein product [Rodentolepis nana]
MPLWSVTLGKHVEVVKLDLLLVVRFVFGFLEVRTHLGGLSPNKDYYVSGNPTSSSTPSTSAAYRQRETETDYFSDFTAMSPAVVIPPGSENEGASWSVPHANATSSPTYRMQHQQQSSTDDFTYDNLPHVGASPCPQNDSSEIPTRSSNFLNFLSPNSRQDRRTTTVEESDLDRTLTNLSPPEPCSLTTAEPPPSAVSSKQPLHVYISEEEHLASQREALHDALSTPTGEADGYDQSHSSSGTVSSNTGSSKGIKVGPSSAGSTQGF